MQTTAGPEESAQAAKPRRPLRRLLLWVGVALGVLALAAYGYYRIRRSRADDTIAWHRKKFAEESVRLAAIPRGRPAIEEPAAEGTAEEVAGEYIAAVAGMPEEDRNYLFENPLADDRAADDRMLARYPGITAPLTSLLRVPSRPSPPTFRVEGDEIRVGNTQAGARWLDATIRLALARGEHAEALRLTLLLTVLGSDAARGGSLVWWLVGHSIESAARLRLRTALAMGPLAAPDAATVRRVMDALDVSRPSLSSAFDDDRETLRGAFATNVSDYACHAGWRHLWSYRIWLADCLETWDEDVDRLREIVARGEEDPVRARADAKTLADAHTERRALVGTLTFLGPMCITKGAQHRAMRRVARTAVALAAYRSDKGHLPGTLADLVPAYLPSVPIDPWDGKALRWSLEKATVWSIGRNGRDDGGTPGGEVGMELPDMEGDVAWTLWNGR